MKKTIYIGIPEDPGVLRPFRISTGLTQLGIAMISAGLINGDLRASISIIAFFAALIIFAGLVLLVATRLKFGYFPENEGIKDVFWVIFIGSVFGIVTGLFLLIIPDIAVNIIFTIVLVFYFILVLWKA